MNDSEKNYLAYGLTVYEQFRWINMRAVTFSFVDQSSSRDLKKFGENIPTSPISPEVIDVHTLNLKPNVKFSRLIFFFWGGTPVPVVVCASKATSNCNT